MHKHLYISILLLSAYDGGSPRLAWSSWPVQCGS